MSTQVQICGFFTSFRGLANAGNAHSRRTNDTAGPAILRTSLQVRFTPIGDTAIAIGKGPTVTWSAYAIYTRTQPRG